MILYILAFVLGLVAGMSINGYLWGKAMEALSELILARKELEKP